MATPVKNRDRAKDGPKFYRVAGKSEVKHAKRVYENQSGETSYKPTYGPLALDGSISRNVTTS